MLDQMVDNLLLILSGGFQISRIGKKTSLYTLHHSQGKGLNTLIVVANLQDDFQFPINLIKADENVANSGDIYTSGVDQFLIVTPLSEIEYVTHAIHSERLLSCLSEWIVKYPVSSKRLEAYELWDVLVPICKLEAIAYKSFTQKIQKISG